MRKLFLVLAKLLGVMQLYWAVISFVQIGFAAGDLLAVGSPSQPPLVPIFAGAVFYLVIELGMAWLLIVRTEWLADRIRIPATEDVSGLDRESALVVGVKLIGVYFAVQAILILFRSIRGVPVSWAGHMPPRVWEGLLDAATQLALGLLLTFRTAQIVSIITQRDAAHDRTKNEERRTKNVSS